MLHLRAIWQNNSLDDVAFVCYLTKYCATFKEMFCDFFEEHNFHRIGSVVFLKCNFILII